MAIRCARCDKVAPIVLDEIVGDGGGDPSLLPVVAPPEGWIGDPDGDGIICGECATPDEIRTWMADMEHVETTLLSMAAEPEDE